MKRELIISVRKMEDATKESIEELAMFMCNIFPRLESEFTMLSCTDIVDMKRKRYITDNKVPLQEYDPIRYLPFQFKLKPTWIKN